MTKSYSFYYEVLPSWFEPEVIFEKVYIGSKQVFWLDSSKVIKGFSRFSYIGDAQEVIRYSLDDKDDTIFSFFKKKLDQIKLSKTVLPFDFVGGYVGYFGYELKKLCGFTNRHTSPFPDSIWFFVDRFFVFDHKEQTVYLACLTKNKKEADDWFEQIRNIINSRFTNRQRKYAIDNVRLEIEVSKEKYLEAIKQCKTYIKKGESYEICLTNQFTGYTKNDPLEIYKKLRVVNPAPYAAYFRDGDLSILSSSPERFLKVDQEGLVEAKPMKGTIARSSDPKEDKRLARQLQKSEKDRAENLMIVDLLRNDLGKVCKVGSIQVSALLKVETYQTVHQMVSTITGKLRSDVSVLDCIKSCFPGGSMTGAPKNRTIEILDKLEISARGVYSGALGYLSANGSADLNIIIRTIVLQKGDISIGTGGAITYQSDEQKEFDEMMLKVKALQKVFTD